MKKTRWKNDKKRNTLAKYFDGMFLWSQNTMIDTIFSSTLWVTKRHHKNTIFFTLHLSRWLSHVKKSRAFSNESSKLFRILFFCFGSSLIGKDEEWNKEIKKNPIHLLFVCAYFLLSSFFAEVANSHNEIQWESLKVIRTNREHMTCLLFSFVGEPFNFPCHAILTRIFWIFFRHLSAFRLFLI